MFDFILISDYRHKLNVFLMLQRDYLLYPTSDIQKHLFASNIFYFRVIKLFFCLDSPF